MIERFKVLSFKCSETLNGESCWVLKPASFNADKRLSGIRSSFAKEATENKNRPKKHSLCSKAKIIFGNDIFK